MENPSPSRLSSEVARELIRIPVEGGEDLSRFPDFLILGPQRTGTSWLFTHLAAHAEIFLPREKETYFFSTLGQPEKAKFRYSTLKDYLVGAMTDSPWRRLLKWCRRGFRYVPELLGDATASNAILEPEVIREICQIRPGIRGVLMLREPVDRVRSHARKSLTAHTERSMDELEFEEIDKFLRAGGQLKKAGYREMIDNWRKELQPGNLMVIEFRQVAEAPELLLTEVLRFLGLDHEVFPGTRRLKKKIYSTGHGRLPDRVEERIAELYGPAIEDYAKILDELQPFRVADGCYRI